jgi:hypothetical protein
MNSMATITGSIEIGCPVDQVFDFVADERNEPKYNPELLRSTKLTSGPIAVGTQFAATHKSRRRPVEMVIEVTEYERPRHLGSRTTMRGADIRGSLRFEPVGNRTRMRWTWEVRPHRVGWLLGPVVGAVGSRKERACWTGLKQYLEHHRPRTDALGERRGS